jgi:hypothetical protein
MSYNKTIWTERDGIKLNRFIKAEETPTSVVLINNPEQITVPGTPFSTDNMNKIEEGIYEIHERLDAEYGALVELLYTPTELEMAKMRILPLQGQVITVATYQRLCDRMYCGNANNATADWWYRISNQNDKNSRDINGLFMVVLDIRGLFKRAAGKNSKYMIAGNTPYDGGSIGSFNADRIKQASGVLAFPAYDSNGKLAIETTGVFTYTLTDSSYGGIQAIAGTKYQRVLFNMGSGNETAGAWLGINLYMRY